MASSNRHWPSMFKSKPHLNPWHLNCHTNSLPQGMNEERITPEPKPRWNPRPEQIRILESIFNSGMVNPPRDEIMKIRAQLQEFGQVGDANVFYWFQNRKSRSKNKHRHQQNPKPRPRPRPPSSDKSSSPSISSNEKPTINSVTASTLMDLLNSPTASVNQPFFQAAASTSTHFLNQPLFDASGLTQGFGFGDHQESVMNCSNHVLLGDDHDQLMLMNHGPLRKDGDDEHIAPHSLSLTSTTNHILQDPDLGQTVPEKMTVFINDVCFEVATSPFNVREAFGHDSMLIQSSGQPVLTDEWGVTQQPLQHGAFYYVVPTNFTPSHKDRKI